MKIKTLLLLSLVLAFPVISYSQESNAAKKMSMHHEVPDDNSFLLPLENPKTSAAYSFKSSSIFTTQVNVNQDGQNILGDAANEPSIAVDPTNPDRMMIGWRQFDNVNNNFRQAGYGYTLDGGQTWTFPGVIDPGVFRSDPVLDCDADGNFYYNSLTLTSNDDFECTVYKIDDGGVEWDDGTYAWGVTSNGCGLTGPTDRAQAIIIHSGPSIGAFAFRNILPARRTEDLVMSLAFWYPEYRSGARWPLAPMENFMLAEPANILILW
jgi:hypothetical protein